MRVFDFHDGEGYLEVGRFCWSEDFWVRACATRNVDRLTRFVRHRSVSAGYTERGFRDPDDADACAMAFVEAERNAK